MMEKTDFFLKLDSPRVWRTYTGGALIDMLHGRKKGEISHFPEEWIMSVVAARNAGREDIKEEGMSRLPEKSNMLLKELIESNPSSYLGEKHVEKYGSHTGVLVKLIDSSERLTVQVHPDRELALKLFGSRFGKTESWHILDTRESGGRPACIYIGFKPGITRECWKTLFDKQDIPGMLEWMHCIEVHKGDTVLIQGGVPHAIGAGCFLAEIQEPTDYTVRIERITPSGLKVADTMCHQGLGFQKMFDCFHYEGVTQDEAVKRWFIRPAMLREQEGGSVISVLGYDATAFFSMEKIEARAGMDMEKESVFSGIYILEGQGTLSMNGKRRKTKCGEQYFIPANAGEWHVEPDRDDRLIILRFRGPQI